MNEPQILKEDQISNETQIIIDPKFEKSAIFPNKPRLQTTPKF